MHRVRNWTFFLCAVALLSASLLFVNYANIYHGELDVYLPHYLSKQSVLNIIYNPLCELDFSKTSFRAREVGSIFNLLDAKLFVEFVKAGVDLLFSPVFYILIVGCVVYSRSTLIKLGVSESTANLLALIFLSMPPVILGGVLYRTNKIVAAGSILLTILIAARFFGSLANNKCNKYNLAFLFLSAIIGCLADEQGLAIISAILAYTLGRAVLGPLRKKWLYISLPILASVLISLAYRAWLGPILFADVNGVPPVTSHSGFAEIGGLHNVMKSVGLLIRYIGYVFGNIYVGTFLGLAFLVALFVTVFFKIAVTSGFSRRCLACVAPAMMLIYTFSLMTVKHHAIYWPEIVSYYSLPLCFFVYGLFLLLCIDLIEHRAASEKRLKFVSVFIIAMNVVSLPSYIPMVLNGHLSVFRVGAVVFEALHASNSELESTLKKNRIQNLTPGAVTQDLSRDGVHAIRQAIGQ